MRNSSVKITYFVQPFDYLFNFKFKTLNSSNFTTSVGSFMVSDNKTPCHYRNLFRLNRKYSKLQKITYTEVYQTTEDKHLRNIV